MATAYPGSLDTSGSQLRTDIASTDDMNASGKEHHLMHVNVHGAAIALETKLGTGSSTASTGAVLMGTGSGASAWDTSPTILGALTVGADGSGHDVTFYSGTAGDSFVWDSSEEKLTITGTNGQVALAVADGNVSIADDLDVDGTLEADAITVDGTALSEYIADTVGAMVGSNTETNITVTYEDSDNTLDFVIGTLNQDTTGTADNVTVSANNSADETVYLTFVDGATGSQGIESDTGLTYNPSSGNLSIGGELVAASLDISGNIDVDGTTNLDVVDIDGAVDMASTLTIANGSASAVGVKFASNAADSGFYYVAEHQIGLASDTHVAMSSANGTGSSGTDAGTIATAAIDTSSTSGYQAVYRNNTFGSLYRWTSMRDTKDNIQSFTDSGATIDALRPVTFVEKARNGESSADKAWREADIQYGFIAEEVAEVADGKFATWEDKDGSLVTNGWRQPDMIALVVAELKSVRQRLTALES